MSKRVFYHSADLDGMCSGAIVKNKFPDVILYPINYGDKFPWEDIETNDEVYMVDFSLSPEDMIKLYYSCTFYWIDHHAAIVLEVKQALRNTYNIPGVDKFNPQGNQCLGDRAACELTWEFLYPEKPVPLTVKLLSLYDSWTFKEHPLEKLVLAMQTRLRLESLDPLNGKDTWFWDEVFESEDYFDGFAAMLEEGILLLDYDAEQKEKYVKTYSFETVLNGHKAIAVNLGHTNSKVFDSVWDESKYDLMITFCRRSDKKWNVSLYTTKDDIDCCSIAKVYGGGGHRQASGLQVNYLPFEY